MKLSKIIGILAAAALALLAFASSASATTLYTNGVRQTGTVTLHATLTGTLATKSTGGAFINTCTQSTTHGWTTGFTGASIPIAWNTHSYTGCASEAIVVDAAGTGSIETIGSGPNGTLRSSGFKSTVPSPFGTLTCTTNNTDIGTITGTTSGSTVLDMNAVINCGFFLPSSTWEGSYIYTGHSIHATA